MNTHVTSPRILFVCLGNICRSPMAEAVLRGMAPDLIVDSAGTGAWHLGEPPHPDAIMAGAARGYDLANLRARRFVPGDLTAFDLVVVMDTDNLSAVEGQRPQGVATPVTRLLDHAPDVGQANVPDPYYTGHFDDTLALIEAGCRGLLDDLGR